MKQSKNYLYINVLYVKIIFNLVVNILNVIVEIKVTFFVYYSKLLKFMNLIKMLEKLILIKNIYRFHYLLPKINNKFSYKIWINIKYFLICTKFTILKNKINQKN